MTSFGLFGDGMRSGAVFSPCRRYRYRLWREWGDPRKRVCFCGVNPSTANEAEDDHTIRKEIGFAQRWGFGALDKVNLFGWADTDQRGLLTAEDPIGIENDCHILHAIDGASRFVHAWGNGKTAAIRRLIAERIRVERVMLYSYGRAERGILGMTADGFARHPLMLAYATPFAALGEE